ncbi:hypothetical protein [Bradyrhizobium sp. 25ACV]
MIDDRAVTNHFYARRNDANGRREYDADNTQSIVDGEEQSHLISRTIIENEELPPDPYALLDEAAHVREWCAISNSPIVAFSDIASIGADTHQA